MELLIQNVEKANFVNRPFCKM